MDQELQARIAPITSRLWMLAPKPVQTKGKPVRQPERTSVRPPAAGS